MNDKSDAKRLAEAVANLAATITEIIDSKVRQLADSAKAGEPVPGGIDKLSPAEGWASVQVVVGHLGISRRTLNTWMAKGFIPYVRIGRRILFKLSSVDEAMKRRLGVNATARASFGPYNVAADVDALAEAITAAQEVFAG